MNVIVCGLKQIVTFIRIKFLGTKLKLIISRLYVDRGTFFKVVGKRLKQAKITKFGTGTPYTCYNNKLCDILEGGQKLIRYLICINLRWSSYDLPIITLCLTTLE